MLIYKIIFPNDKIYIGLTNSKYLSERKKTHKFALVHNKFPTLKLYRAMKKYGWLNLKWEVIENNIETRDKLIALEKYYINKFDTFNNGYNMTLGGDGLDPNDTTTIEKIRSSVNDYYNSEIFDRVKHSRDRGGYSIKVFDKNKKFIGIFATQRECCEQLDLQPSKVCNVLKGKRPQHKGYTFEKVV